MSTVCVILSLVIGSIQLLNSHGLRRLPPEELNTTAIGEYKAFINTMKTILTLVSELPRNSTDANTICQQMNMHLVKKENINGALCGDSQTNKFWANKRSCAFWGDSQTDKLWVHKQSCDDNVQCAAVSQPDNLLHCEEDCRSEHKFLCREEVYKLLLVHNGHLGFHFNDTWIPLCFLVNITQQENSEICNKTYTLHRNKYKYDDVGIGCNKQTELSCPEESPTSFNITTSDMAEFVEHKRISLTCSVVGGKPKPDIIMATQGKVLNTTVNDTQLMLSKSVILTLSREDDNNIFTCCVIYKNETFGQKNYTLRVLYRPIAVVPKYVEVNESDVVVLQCNVSSNPQSNVTWTGPNGKEESTETTLNFGEIGRAAIGNYTCRATNKIGNDSVTAEIFINAPPKINLFLHSVTDQNQSVIMRCAATGIPTPEITWSKDSILIVTNSSKYSIASMISPTNQYLVLSTLTVFNVGENDVVGHTCSIENKNGKTQKTFRIRRKLKCRCLSRYLKNRVPLNYTQDELQQEMDKTREELVVKNPTQKLIKKISASDKRTSAKYIGAIGVVVIAGVLTLIIVSDVLGCFYNVKSKVKLKKNKVKPEQKHL